MMEMLVGHLSSGAEIAEQMEPIELHEGSKIRIAPPIAATLAVGRSLLIKAWPSTAVSTFRNDGKPNRLPSAPHHRETPINRIPVRGSAPPNGRTKLKMDPSPRKTIPAIAKVALTTPLGVMNGRRRTIRILATYSSNGIRKTSRCRGRSQVSTYRSP